MRRGIGAVALATAYIAGGSLVIDRAGAVPPAPPATIQAVDEMLDGAPGAAIPLRLRVARSAPVERLSVSSSIRPAEATAGTVRRWQADALAGPGDEAEIQVRLPSVAGRYEVEVLLSGEVAGRTMVLDRLTLPLSVAPPAGGATPFSAAAHSRAGPARATRLPADGGTREVRPWPERLRGAPPRPPTPLRAPVPVAAAPVSAAGPDLTVRGRVLLEDLDGELRSVPYARVVVTRADRELGQAFADREGNFAVGVEPGTGPVGLLIKLDSGSVAVRPADGATYAWPVDGLTPVPGNPELDFGDLLTPTEAPLAGAASAFAVANLAWTFVDARIGADPGRVEIRYPAASTAYQQRWWRIDLTEKGAWNPDTILHEYGHFLMDRAYPLDCPDLPGEDHTLGDPDQDPGVAMSEGWATGFALAVCPDGAYDFGPDGQGRRGGWPECEQPSVCGHPIETYRDPGGTAGERSEGRVAAAINDLLDAPDDHGGDDPSLGEVGSGDRNAGQEVGFATLYRDAMLGRCLRDAVGLRSALRDVLAGDRLTLALEAFRYNYVGRFAPESEAEAETPAECVAPGL